MLIVHLQLCQTLCSAQGIQQQGRQNICSVLHFSKWSYFNLCGQSSLF